MEENHKENLAIDFQQTQNLKKRSIIKFKLIAYRFERPLVHFFLKKYLSQNIKDKSFLQNVDIFLLDGGGMFKEFTYSICNKIFKLENSFVLVPGAGYGNNIYRLAKFRPKLIFCFDLYEFKEDWDFLSKKIYEDFGVKTQFVKGGFEAVPDEYKNSFDFIISDAVLEHVDNLEKFSTDSKKFLKRGGTFFASFGPIWYGPGGDHIDWGENGIFNHLLLNKKEYEMNLNKLTEKENDSVEGIFLAKHGMFSYLKANEYFEILLHNGFKKILSYAQISKKAIRLLKKQPALFQELTRKGVPEFDRFCSGFCVWLKNGE